MNAFDLLISAYGSVVTARVNPSHVVMVTFVVVKKSKYREKYSFRMGVDQQTALASFSSDDDEEDVGDPDAPPGRLRVAIVL